VTDIDPGVIRQWQASRSLAEQVAARLAAELRGRQRWDPVDGNFRLAVRMGVSESTARRAKALLAGHGAIMQDGRNRAAGYYVA
jgi:DNA-binding GntR family transcriptional regulator